MRRKTIGAAIVAAVERHFERNGGNQEFAGIESDHSCWIPFTESMTISLGAGGAGSV